MFCLLQNIEDYYVTAYGICVIQYDVGWVITWL